MGITADSFLAYALLQFIMTGDGSTPGVKRKTALMDVAS